MNLLVYVSDETWNREEACKGIEAWLHVNGFSVPWDEIVHAFDSLREKYQAYPGAHFKIPGYEVIRVFLDFLYGQR